MASKRGEPHVDQGPSPDEGFEALYRRLEETVSRLENGGLTLEESLSLYEEGMKLARRCQEILHHAELRITKLQEAFSGDLGAVGEEAGDYDADVLQDELPLE